MTRLLPQARRRDDLQLSLRFLPFFSQPFFQQRPIRKERFMRNFKAIVVGFDARCQPDQPR